MRIPYISMLAAGALALGGCAYGGFGYGVGYNLTPRFSVDVVQDQITTLHQKTGLSAGQSTSARLTTTRIIARFGLGTRMR